MMETVSGPAYSLPVFLWIMQVRRQVCHTNIVITSPLKDLWRYFGQRNFGQPTADRLRCGVVEYL